MTNDIHSAASLGFSNEAPAYERGRPEYPAALMPWLRDELGLAEGRTVVDLGAGTGKFSKLLVASGADVIAIEPVAKMRERLAATLPQVQALAGSAQAMPIADGSADAIVCAQAFHWFATEPALADMHRVLRPSGRLGLIWNVRDESVDWVAALTRIMEPHQGDAPRFYKGEWRAAFNGRYFSELQLTRFAHRHTGSPQQVIVDRCLSVSFIASLPAAEKARVEKQLLDLIEGHPALRGQATVTMPYETLAYCCERLPG